MYHAFVIKSSIKIIVTTLLSLRFCVCNIYRNKVSDVHKSFRHV